MFLATTSMVSLACVFQFRSRGLSLVRKNVKSSRGFTLVILIHGLSIASN